MLKVRMMGTRGDIHWFQRAVQNCPEIEVTELSDIYSNKGTDRYHRAYMEVRKKRRTER